MAKRETFSVAGIATDKNGITKVRYANNLEQRLVTLFQNKFTNINFIQLPNAMTKIEACEYLLTTDKFVEQRDLITIELRKKLRKEKVTAQDILNAIK
jgi:hypothetical protein